MMPFVSLRKQVPRRSYKSLWRSKAKATPKHVALGHSGPMICLIVIEGSGGSTSLYVVLIEVGKDPKKVMTP